MHSVAPAYRRLFVSLGPGMAESYSRNPRDANTVHRHSRRQMFHHRPCPDSQLGKRSVQNLTWTGAFIAPMLMLSVRAQGRTLMGHQTTRPMKYGTFAVLVLLLLGFPPRGHSQNNSLQKLFSDYYEFQLREDPGQATFLGRTEYNDRWDDPSPEHHQQHRKSLQQFLGRLQAIPEKPLTGQDRLSYRLLDWQLRDQIADAEIISTFYSVNQLIGGHLNIFSVVAIAPADTVKDYEK